MWPLSREDRSAPASTLTAELGIGIPAGVRHPERFLAGDTPPDQQRGAAAVCPDWAVYIPPLRSLWWAILSDGTPKGFKQTFLDQWEKLEVPSPFLPKFQQIIPWKRGRGECGPSVRRVTARPPRRLFDEYLKRLKAEGPLGGYRELIARGSTPGWNEAISSALQGRTSPSRSHAERSEGLTSRLIPDDMALPESAGPLVWWRPVECGVSSAPGGPAAWRDPRRRAGRSSPRRNDAATAPERLGRRASWHAPDAPGQPGEARLQGPSGQLTLATPPAALATETVLAPTASRAGSWRDHWRRQPCGLAGRRLRAAAGWERPAQTVTGTVRFKAYLT